MPKCTGGLCPILSLEQFFDYMHIPTFKMQLIQQLDYAFSTDLKNAYLHKVDIFFALCCMILHIRTKICKVLKNRNIIKLHGGTSSFRPEEDDLKDSESFLQQNIFCF